MGCDCLRIGTSKLLADSVVFCISMASSASSLCRRPEMKLLNSNGTRFLLFQLHPLLGNVLHKSKTPVAMLWYVVIIVQVAFQFASSLPALSQYTVKTHTH